MISCWRSPHSWRTRKNRLRSASGKSWGSLRSFLGLRRPSFLLRLLADVEEVGVVEPLLAGDADDLGDDVRFRFPIRRDEIGPLSCLLGHATAPRRPAKLRLSPILRNARLPPVSSNRSVAGGDGRRLPPPGGGARVNRDWNADELAEHWTLLPGEKPLLANKTGPTRLGFAVLLKFFQHEGRFPRHRQEVPGVAVEYLARQIDVAPGEWARYDWDGRTIKYHRAQIRALLGFREATVEDGEALAAWLAEHVLPHDQHPDHLHDAGPGALPGFAHRASRRRSGSTAWCGRRCTPSRSASAPPP